jgi:hypothetical protein
VPELLAASDEPVDLRLLARLLLIRRTAEGEVHLALLDVHLFGVRRGARARQADLVLGGPGVQVGGREEVIAGAAIGDVPAGLLAFDLALSQAPDVVLAPVQPRSGVGAALVLRGVEAGQSLILRRFVYSFQCACSPSVRSP